MANDLQSLRKGLKSFAKRCKDFKYTESALLTFLLCGTIVSNNLFSAEVKKQTSVGSNTQALNNFVKNEKLKIKTSRSRHKKLLNGLNLELIELMEQGEHVTKSPWSSWQFAINEFSNDWNGTYKGRGDKTGGFIYAREVGKAKYTQKTNNNRYGTTRLNLIDTAEPKVPIHMNASINPRVLTKGRITPPDKTVNVPTLPETVEFTPVSPSIPTITPSTITITPITLSAIWNSSGLDTVGLNRDVTTPGTYDLLPTTKARNQTDPGGKNWNGARIAETIMDIGGTPGKGFTIAAGATINIKRDGTRAAVIDAGNWGLSTLQTTSVTNNGKINLYNQTTAGLEVQGNPLVGDFSLINSGEIIGHGSKQVALTLTPEQPNAHGSIQTLKNNTKIDMAGSQSVGLNIVNRKLYRSTENAALNKIYPGGFYNDLKTVAINSSGAEITLGGTNSYGIAFGALGHDSQLTEGSVFQNSGNINVNNDSSGGIAVKAAKYWVDVSGKDKTFTATDTISATLENTSTGKITVKGTNSFGIYSEEINGTNHGAINIEGSKDYSIALRANKTGTVIPTLTNNGTVSISSTGKENIGFYTKNAKVVNNAGKTVSITAGQNIGMAVYGTSKTDYGEGTNAGTITANSAGSIGVITSNYGKVTNTGTIGVTGGNTSDNNKGTVAVIVGKNSTIDSSNGTINATVTDNKSIGVYSDGTLKLGTGTISADAGAINYFADNNGEIEVVSGKTSTATTGQKSLLFYNGTTGTGKVKISGTLNATVAGGTDATNRGTAFYYVPSTTSATGSAVGYNNTVNYGAFGASDISGYFATTFSGTIANLNLTMQNDSRLFLASKVKMNLSDTNISSVPGGPTITGSNYKNFMLYLSEVKVDNAVDLDNATDLYNTLEISNSSIINQNKISGNDDGRVAMAQENKTVSKPAVTLMNDTAGTIELNGKNALAIYAKYGNVVNRGQITLTGKDSTGLYGVENSKVINESTGKITLDGESGAAMYYTNTSATKLTSEIMQNDGTIDGESDSSIGMIYDAGKLDASVSSGTATLVKNTGTISLTGDKNVGIFTKPDTLNKGYVTENSGNIILKGDSATLSNPNVGIYTTGKNNTIKTNAGSKIETGAKTVGIFGYAVENSGDITVGSGGVAIYSQNGDIALSDGTIKTGNDEAVGLYLVGENQNAHVNVNAKFDLGDNSFGIVNANATGNNYITSSATSVGLGSRSVYSYSADKLGVIANYTDISTKNATSRENFGIYSSGRVDNHGNINFENGIGNVGIYVTGTDGKAFNLNGGTITISKSDVVGNNYSIGMAAKNGAVAENEGIINVTGDNGIGMYASGPGSKVINKATGVINLSGDSTIGMYLDDYAVGENYGTIQTAPNSTGEGIMGVYALNNAVIKNYGTIRINAVDGIGVYVGKDASLEGNTSTNDISATGTDSEHIYRTSRTDTSKGVRGIRFSLPHLGSLTADVIRNDVNVTPTLVDTDIATPSPNYVHLAAGDINLNTFDPLFTQNNGGGSSIGMYVDTSGVRYTNPIQGLENLTRLRKINLIFGIEATQYTDSKDIQIGNNIIAPYNAAIMSVSHVNPAAKWEIFSSSLLWIATATQNPDQTIANVYLSKIPFNSFAEDGDTDNYNFLTGLEEKEALKDVTERKIFNKLNGLGKGEAHILAQAVDEMKGHQYSNIQQRIYETGNTLSKEFKYLQEEWRNPSKQSNKIKAFGNKGELKTNTAGVIDYTNNAYGVAYVHEDEAIKLGNSSGWYAGVANNQFKLKDIGHSRENQTMIKAGIFKTMAPKQDHNGSLTWRISAETFAGRGDMKRKYWVVDDTYEAKGDYNIYGVALKNEIGKTIRTTEKTSIRPYGLLNMEYGKYSNIKESGPMALEIKGNDYFSVKPEAGLAFNFKQTLGARSNLKINVTAAYENELGKLNNVQNKARFRGTQSEYYNLHGDKENRKGNGKFDLNLGWDNTLFGITVNAGYDTTGKNFRSGIGFRAIY